MRYVLLLRGINVGGRNKIVMAELRQAVADLGYDKVETYINSGNLFFDSTKNRGDIVAEFQTFFTERYPFVEQFALLDAQDYQAEIDQLPVWWQEELARKDVLFFTEGLDKQAMVDYIQSLHLGDEVLHLSEHAIYWGKYTEGSYLQTAYHRQLAKLPFYKQVTIRMGRLSQLYQTI
ncbi:DUF1697 domain-containing protein [Streptococcus suis]|uniref:Phosphopentomutase n=1 Tax=Streptococcus suis TaxID=1307 RepID=A0A116LK61_STRSU|nr:DUF1697 domain-containing protein [Streptococcus suis]NQH23559.1 DUF1697 domain-containing protein [Streptococcus suis]NQP21238.1 DUF1697 domain-containing protein [Streptococcus suis]NQP41768.1 DUF1697 domain-containing protein [Streptococcus suis]CYU97049.1 phosphopentomutase [Streptococcus suis]